MKDFFNDIAEKMPDGWVMNVCLTNEELWFLAEDTVGNEFEDEIEAPYIKGDSIEGIILELLDRVLKIEEKKKTQY